MPHWGLARGGTEQCEEGLQAAECYDSVPVVPLVLVGVGFRSSGQASWQGPSRKELQPTVVEGGAHWGSVGDTEQHEGGLQAGCHEP